MTSPAGALVAWRLVDGRRGHENQSRGLLAALGERTRAEGHVIQAPAAGRAARWWLTRRFPPGEDLPDPDLVLGAGHACHLPMLAARRARGGRAVVLMRPTLPLAWFDLCLVPEHDRPPERANVIATRGALNAVRTAGARSRRAGLILVGGPSRAFAWEEGALARKIGRVLASDDVPRWTVSTSRRTPRRFTERLHEVVGGRAEVVPADSVDADWLPGRLAVCTHVWVSQDSVSMIYEALTAGAAVGVFELPARGRSRVGDGVARLVDEGQVVPFGAWRAGTPLAAPSRPLDEAGRCAALILERWAAPGRRSTSDG